jgi:uncharacterized protein YecT (DUF1311 family)
MAKVVVLVHGIRTYAQWVPAVRHELESAGFVVEPTNYGYLDLLRFIVPIAALHNGPIDEVWKSIRTIVRQYPNSDINILAHSFGTYVVARLLAREFDFKANRVVFCGSIVARNFPFNQILDRATWPILNEVGCLDVWPALAESVTWGYGSTGTYGFRSPPVKDRWHRKFGHSEFLTSQFCKRFWVPFFRDGQISEGDLEFKAPPLLLRALSIVKLKYVGVLAVAIGMSVVFMGDPYPSFDCVENTRPTDQAICHSRSLAAKDRQMDYLYRRLRDGLSGTERSNLTDQQRNWWSNNRSMCGAVTECIARDYDARNAQLRAALDRLHR